MPTNVTDLLDKITLYFRSETFYWEVGASISVLFLGFFLAQILRTTAYKKMANSDWSWISKTLTPALIALTMPGLFMILLTVVESSFEKQGLAVAITPAFSSIAIAWFLFSLVKFMTQEKFWRRLVGSFIVIITILGIFQLLEPAQSVLGSIGISFGEVNLNLLGLLKGLSILLLLMWLSLSVSKMAETTIRNTPNITPSMEVLFSKVLKVTLVSLSILFGMSAIGIKLSSLAIFSGAIGLGVGFGLQKVISNLISGVILLLDKSIKPGDVISIGSTYGWINKLSARYVSVITRDGRETLIPNEDLITNQVENWSFSDTKVRIRSSIGVSYNTDVRKAIDLCIEAANAVPRVLKDPEPKCPVKGFGDNSVDIELRFWISDPANGVANIKSDVYLEVWDRFKEHGIEIPFPQRDLHIRTNDTLKVPPPNITE